MSPETLLLLYVLSLLGGLAVVAFYCELRLRRFEFMPTEDHVFRCETCQFVYTDDPDVERSRCPQCGTLNDTFQF